MAASRIARAIALAFAALLGSASIVAAAPPTREAAPFVGFTDDSCGFPVVVTAPIQNEYATTFYDNDGNPTMLLITGRLVLTFTNPANHVSITANVPGPGRINLVTGSGYSYGSGGGPVPGGLILGHGRLNLATFELNGHQIDLCPILAGA